MKDISFHYTSEPMVHDLLKRLELKGKSVLDAGSGRNKVWYKELRRNGIPAIECELEDGINFYDLSGEVGWVVGNPPYHESWKFTQKAIEVATEGVAWLLNNQALNSHLTPARLQMLHEKGWHYTGCTVVADKRWFGRYYFLVLERKPSDFISWERKTY